MSLDFMHGLAWSVQVNVILQTWMRFIDRDKKERRRKPVQ